jgi:anti-sigma factor RsiW
MECKRIIDATFLCLDNEMDAEARQEYEAHLRVCAACNQRRAIIVACLEAIRRSPACRCQAPRSLEDRIRQCLKDRGLRDRGVDERSGRKRSLSDTHPAIQNP